MNWRRIKRELRKQVAAQVTAQGGTRKEINIALRRAVKYDPRRA